MGSSISRTRLHLGCCSSIMLRLHPLHPRPWLLPSFVHRIGVHSARSSRGSLAECPCRCLVQHVTGELTESARRWPRAVLTVVTPQLLLTSAALVVISVDATKSAITTSSSVAQCIRGVALDAHTPPTPARRSNLRRARSPGTLNWSGPCARPSAVLAAEASSTSRGAPCTSGGAGKSACPTSMVELRSSAERSAHAAPCCSTTNSCDMPSLRKMPHGTSERSALLEAKSSGQTWQCRVMAF